MPNSDDRDEFSCLRCNGPMEEGKLTLSGPFGMHPALREATVVFVAPGIRTSLNPLTAFKQGLEDQPRDQECPIRPFRCDQCGRIEFYSTGESGKESKR